MAKNVSLEMLTYYDGKLKTWTKAEDATNLASAKTYTDEQIAALPEAAEYSIVKAETAEEGYAASYNLTKDGVNVGATINIPKDYLVKSGEVKTVETADTPVSGYKVGNKYIDFVVNTVDGTGNESHIYLLVSDLVDVYTAGNDGIEVSADNKISLVVQDGSKTVGGVSAADYTSFNTAVTKSAANETAIGTLQTDVTSAKSNITSLQSMVDSMQNETTGVVAQSKTYADSLNTAMDTRVAALEAIGTATTDDIDALF